jgi:RNA polymerase sigma-70 factor (ECF subfamily)
MRAVQATAVERNVGDSLVARAAIGDEGAFARIVAAHHDDMARVAFIVCRDVQLAQEAASAAWPIAWRRLSSLRDPAKLRPWLLAITANEARGLARRQGRRALREIAVDPMSEHTAAPGTTDPAERVALIDLSNALARLDAADRMVVGLSAAGLSSSEIGQVIGMSSSGVRARLGRVLGRLREDLRDG